MAKKLNQKQLYEGWLTDLVSAFGSSAQKAAARSTASNAAARSATDAGKNPDVPRWLGGRKPINAPTTRGQDPATLNTKDQGKNPTVDLTPDMRVRDPEYKDVDADELARELDTDVKPRVRRRAGSSKTLSDIENELKSTYTPQTGPHPGERAMDLAMYDFDAKEIEDIRKSLARSKIEFNDAFKDWTPEQWNDVNTRIQRMATLDAAYKKYLRDLDPREAPMDFTDFASNVYFTSKPKLQDSVSYKSNLARAVLEDEMTAQQEYDLEYAANRLENKYPGFKKRYMQWITNLRDAGVSDSDISKLTTAVDDIYDTGAWGMEELWPWDKLKATPQEWLYGNPIDAGGYATDDGELTTSKTGWNQVSRYDGPDSEPTRTVLDYDPESTATSAADIAGKIRRPLDPDLISIMSYPEDPNFDKYDSMQGSRVSIANEDIMHIFRSTGRKIFNRIADIADGKAKPTIKFKNGDTVTIDPQTAMRIASQWIMMTPGQRVEFEKSFKTSEGLKAVVQHFATAGTGIRTKGSSEKGSRKVSRAMMDPALGESVLNENMLGQLIRRIFKKINDKKTELNTKVDAGELTPQDTPKTRSGFVSPEEQAEIVAALRQSNPMTGVRYQDEFAATLPDQELRDTMRNLDTDQGQQELADKMLQFRQQARDLGIGESVLNENMLGQLIRRIFKKIDDRMTELNTKVDAGELTPQDAATLMSNDPAMLKAKEVQQMMRDNPDYKNVIPTTLGQRIQGPDTIVGRGGQVPADEIDVAQAARDAALDISGSRTSRRNPNLPEPIPGSMGAFEEKEMKVDEICAGGVASIAKPFFKKRSKTTEDTVKYEDHYDDRVVLTVEKDKLLYNGNPIQNYDWNSSAKDMINPKFYARAKSWEEVHGYLARFLDNPKGLQAAVRQVFITNNEGIQVNETVMVSEAQFDEAAGEKDACYHKVKSRYKVWPSAYASGALVKCRKVGAKNWGNKSKK